MPIRYRYKSEIEIRQVDYPKLKEVLKTSLLKNPINVNPITICNRNLFTFILLASP